MTRVARSMRARRRGQSGGRSKIATARIVDRRIGSFSMCHMSASSSLMCCVKFPVCRGSSRSHASPMRRSTVCSGPVGVNVGPVGVNVEVRRGVAVASAPRVSEEAVSDDAVIDDETTSSRARQPVHARRRALRADAAHARVRGVPNAMHGGAPSALMAYVLARHDPGPADFIARLTVELLRPVPLAPLQVVGAHVPAREEGAVAGRRAARRRCRGRARGRAASCGRQAVDVARRVSPAVDMPPPPAAGAPPAFQFFDREHVGYWTANEIRLVAGGFGIAGPATAWLRLRCPVVDGEPVAPFERVAAAADFGSGIGNPLTFVDRVRDQSRGHDPRAPPSGGRMGVPRVRRLGRCRTVSASPTRRLYDEQGLLGRGSQTLLVTPIAAAATGFARRASDAAAVSAARQSSSRTRTTSAAWSSNSPLRYTMLAGRPDERRPQSRPGCGRRAPRSCAGRPR